MTGQFVLYGSPHSQYTYKLALMLRASATPFSFRYVSFQREMHRTPEFRAISRWGQVPVLRHGDRVLVQSGAILEYLAETLGAFAGETGMRQHIREWLFWDADRFAPAVYGCYGVVLGERKLLPIAVDPVLADDYRQRAEAALGVLNENLGGREFLVGTGPTIADICCYGETAFAELCGFDLAAWASVAAWTRRVATLPGFAPPLELLPMQDAEFG